MTDAADPRPRPQYGEYATAEEQQARIRQPDVTEALDAGVAAAPAAAPVVVAAPAVGEPQEADAAPAPKRRPVNRIVTFALLAYGLITVVTSFNALVDYNAYADQVLGMMGLDTALAEGLDGRSFGIAAALTLIVGWAVTALLSWMVLARGHISWWIPIVGGVVFTTISAALMLIPLMGDQAVWDAIVGGVG